MHSSATARALEDPQSAGDAKQLADAPPLVAADRLTPTSRGTYAIFEPPDGSIHLVYRAEGATEDAHLHLPAAMVKMAKSMADGNMPLPGPLGKIMGIGMKKAAKQRS